MLTELFILNVLVVVPAWIIFVTARRIWRFLKTVGKG